MPLKAQKKVSDPTQPKEKLPAGKQKGCCHSLIILLSAKGRKSNCVKEVEKLKKNREERRFLC